jgi:DNA-binding IclR family transcriptional regulator
VEKALAIIDSFTPDIQTQGVTEIATKFAMLKSTVHALLATLREEGYIIYDPVVQKYSLRF